MTEFDLPVSSFMTAPVHTLRSTARLLEAAQRMDELDVSALPIVDAGHLIGVLDRADLIRAGRLRRRPAEGEPRWWWPDLSVAECMQTSVPVTAPGRSLEQCARRMHERGLQRIYVVVDRELAGVISTREMMQAVTRAGVETPVAHLGLGSAATVGLDEAVSVASERFCASAARAPLVVVDGQRAVGVFSRSELRACLEADAGQATSLFMDDRIVVVPQSTPTNEAAQRALDARARYVITEGPEGYRVLSGLEFAGIVSGRPAAEAGVRGDARLPAVSVAAPGFNTATFDDESAPFWPRPEQVGTSAARGAEPAREPRRENGGGPREPK